MIKIITDSTCDISNTEAAKLGIEIVPLTIRFGLDEYLDGVNITHQEFYNKLDNSSLLPETSQASPAVFEEIFTKHIKNNDEILGIFISSELSGTFQSASIAAASVLDDYPDAAIRLIDSRNVSIGCSLLIREALKMTNANMPIDTIVSACEELTSRIRLYAYVGTLKYLKKGGRLSGCEALVGSMLHITPIISVTDGKVVIAGKVRGRKTAAKFISDRINEDIVNKSSTFVYGHVNAPDYLEPLKISTASFINECDAISESIGCVVGTHLGTGTVGVAYIENASECVLSKNKALTA